MDRYHIVNTVQGIFRSTRTVYQTEWRFIYVLNQTAIHMQGQKHGKQTSERTLSASHRSIAGKQTRGPLALAQQQAQHELATHLAATTALFMLAAAIAAGKA